MFDLKEQKRALRTRVIAEIQAVPAQARRLEEQKLLARLDELPGLRSSQTVMLYVSAFDGEINTRPLLRSTLAQGKRLICPRVERNPRRLALCQIFDLERDLEPGPFGILEPKRSCVEVHPLEIDWILVPGVAFDASADRLGRGGGYYDRLLPFLKPDTARWALALEVQCVERVPIEPHDQPLDGVLSSGQIVTSSRRNS